MKIVYDFQDLRELNVGTMFCVGKNYAAHAKEMGGEVPAEPVIFLKPPQAFVKNGSEIKLPDISQNVHHEVELIVVIGKDCKDIEPEEAGDYIIGYAVGLDLTLRDIQNQAKNEGKPWTTAKAFYMSAPISEVIPKEKVQSNLFDIELKVNGELRQKVNTSLMERSVETLVSYLSKVFTLRAGDCIFTGTPEGVGKINPGDSLLASLNDLAHLEVYIK